MSINRFVSFLFKTIEYQKERKKKKKKKHDKVQFLTNAVENSFCGLWSVCVFFLERRKKKKKTVQNKNNTKVLNKKIMGN